MKLNQKASIRQSHHNSEFEQFKTQILKQADGFGLSIAAAKPMTTDPFAADTQRYYLERSARIRSAYMINSLKGWSYTITRVTKEWVASHWKKYQSRAQIKRLLRLTDYYLEDIGFHRADLEAALVSPIDLNLIRRSPLDNMDQNKVSVYFEIAATDERAVLCDDIWAKAA